MANIFEHRLDSPIYQGTVKVNTSLFIDGKFVESIDKGTIDVYNPAKGEVITKISAANAKDIDVAVKAAQTAFKNSWGLKVSGYDRGRMLYKLADLIEEHADELAALEALNAGKMFAHVKHGEVPHAVKVIRYFAGWADKNHGQTIETNEQQFAYTRNEPIGVCALILPWNFPLMTATTKFVAALATGNTIVMKPSEMAPLSIMKLAEFFNEAGFPPGTVNIVTGYGHTAGQALAEHLDIGKISFTGSTVVGRKIMEASGKSNLKRVTLELGGKSPTIIFDDAEFEKAVQATSRNIFHHSGQMCTAASRIFVQEGIYDRFVESFSTVAQSIKQGDGFNPENQQGPVVSETQMKRVLGYIESGKAEGAKVVTGGARKDSPGYFIQPTIFTEVKPEMKIVREEIFGPVCAIIKFKDEQEVIKVANDTTYGLSCQLFTQNMSRALRVAHALEAGQALVNGGRTDGPGVPFGGFKQSGFGKELGQQALEAFTNVKAVHVSL
ncbi:putative 1-pyrroline-5-carboxylate dehydrogenase [Cytidiella melzeri]|nr:putative 1-pyrroline-5-carboxylate dehydrogenase [Cytidiella melzeri]